MDRNNPLLIWCHPLDQCALWIGPFQPFSNRLLGVFHYVAGTKLSLAHDSGSLTPDVSACSRGWNRFLVHGLPYPTANMICGFSPCSRCLSEVNVRFKWLGSRWTLSFNDSTGTTSTLVQVACDWCCFYIVS